jgi:hypothetical protein
MARVDRIESGAADVISRQFEDRMADTRESDQRGAMLPWAFERLVNREPVNDENLHDCGIWVVRPSSISATIAAT